MNWDERDERRPRFDRCRERPEREPAMATASPMEELASSVGDAVARLIRSLDPATTNGPSMFGAPGRERAWSGGWGSRSNERMRLGGGDDHRYRHAGRDIGCGCGCERGCGPECSCDTCQPQCGPDPCQCSCCIGDVDLVVYARVGERRIVPIRIDNTRKRARDIELDLGRFTTKGGNDTPVTGRIVTETAFTVDPCSAHEALLVIEVAQPGDGPRQPIPTSVPTLIGDRDPSDMTKAELVEIAREIGMTGVSSMNKDELVAAVSAVRMERGIVAEIDRPAPREIRDVDDCHVAVADLRVQGCDTRPVRIAVAVLPRVCSPYDIRCDCRCC